MLSPTPRCPNCGKLRSKEKDFDGYYYCSTCGEDISPNVGPIKPHTRAVAAVWEVLLYTPVLFVFYKDLEMIGVVTIGIAFVSSLIFRSITGEPLKKAREFKAFSTKPQGKAFELSTMLSAILGFAFVGVLFAISHFLKNLKLDPRLLYALIPIALIVMGFRLVRIFAPCPDFTRFRLTKKNSDKPEEPAFLVTEKD